MSQGYRKIPGNRCMGGLDLAPKMMMCSLAGHFTWGNVLLFTVVILCLCFFKPIISTLVIMLPIPDPKDVKDRIMGLFSGGGGSTNGAP